MDNISYDKNGNIGTLKRQGHTKSNATTLDVMYAITYTCTGKQLKAVYDDIATSATQGFVDGAKPATEYTYDLNGNMISDANKGITDIS